jgi:hypothetical protein
MENPPYSPFADWLSKFHMASEPIQALWIVALAVVALGFCWSLAAPFRLWLAGRRPWRGPGGELIYGVYRDPDGRFFVVCDGRVRAVEDASAARFAARRLTAPDG